ncbi:AAA domain-containing protein [Halapricum sp. CBA1109]|uniref:AAA family ATPase n=1 Tax=Halapricum sp. CBA1109 TaxID=2668068 RepID=UPI0012FBE37D|nr:MoxR family ATPase [Halapricum sp. CBA1109]MUV90480.1 AAA domain-containing protein [Halapricum sp. CBA1109]
METQEATRTCRSVLDRVGDAVVADDRFLSTIMTGVLARGHVLLEDVPGTGKTLTARSFARALGLEFQRIQFTPDLLPSDITGSNIYDKETGQFSFAPGPVFANVVLADEINRAPPKTQAALLEAMSEGQVTVDGDTHDLPDPFFVIATQNPIEQEGTFALPEAQRDRFAVKTSMGYPDRAGERTLVDRRADRDVQTPSVGAVTDRAEVRALQTVPESVRVDDKIRDYVVDIGRATRADDRVEVGVSPRGVQRLFETARASAVLAGREYVVPDDVKRVAPPTLSHRLVLTADASVQGVDPTAVVRDVLDAVSVPAVASAAGDHQKQRTDDRAQ